MRKDLLVLAVVFALAGACPAQTNSDLITNSSPAPTAVAPPDLTPSNASASPAQPQEEEIADIRPPFFFLHSWLWLWIALGVVGLIALAVVLWNWFKPTRLLSPKTAYELTLEKLEKARALLSEENPMPYAVLVSETIRDYLGQRFQAPSTRRTTEEFLRQMQEDPATPLAEHRDLLKGFLQSCDLVKFARYLPEREELERVHQRAMTFVTATRPLPLPPAAIQNSRQPA